MAPLPVFVDSSALVALFDADDARHPHAARVWNDLVDGVRAGSRRLVTHHAVVVETSAVLARRFGMRAQDDLFGSLLRRVRIVWITEDLHDQARTAVLRESRRGLSLVDWLSFSVMRAERIRHAFAFDPDFDEQGFLPPPGPASG